MSVPLWGGERIKESVCEAVPLYVVELMRNEYENELAKLRAQLAGTWQPIENGKLNINHQMYDCDVFVNDSDIARVGRSNDKREVTIVLPDDLRVCRKTT